MHEVLVFSWTWVVQQSVLHGNKPILCETPQPPRSKSISILTIHSFDRSSSIESTYVEKQHAPLVVCVSSHANAGMTPLCSRLSVTMSHKLRRGQEYIIATLKPSLSWHFRVRLHALCCVHAYPHLYSHTGCFKYENDDDSDSQLDGSLVAPTKRYFLLLDPGPVLFHPNIYCAAI